MVLGGKKRPRSRAERRRHEFREQRAEGADARRLVHADPVRAERRVARALEQALDRFFCLLLLLLMRRYLLLLLLLRG